MQAKASINAPPKSPFCVIGNNGFMFGRASGHSHSALTSWQRLLNPAQNPHSTVIFISVIFLLFPSLMTAPVSSHCLQSDRAPEWTGGVIDYWQLSDRILNYYSRGWWLAGLGSALLLSMLTESFSSSLWILKCSFVRCISTSDPETLNSGMIANEKHALLVKGCTVFTWVHCRLKKWVSCIKTVSITDPIRAATSQCTNKT